ncbi:MAG: hypothetical protein ACJ8DG_19805, partial [Microvirga sp.]
MLRRSQPTLIAPFVAVLLLAGCGSPSSETGGEARQEDEATPETASGPETNEDGATVAEQEDAGAPDAREADRGHYQDGRAREGDSRQHQQADRDQYQG